MRRSSCLLFTASLCALAIGALPIGAHAQEREPLPWFAVDLHAATLGLPTAEGWIPVVPLEAPVPGRAWGVSGAATAYPVRAGIFTFGIGVALSTAQGKSDVIEPFQDAEGNTIQFPSVSTRVINVLPQVSVNFGHKLGWSYLSAGLGRTKVDSRADAVGEMPAVMVPAAWNQALNFGGGARWFMKGRLGAGFDVRFVKLGTRAASGDLPSARRTQMITFSAGISLR